MQNEPMSAAIVHGKDGYKRDAMLFVDEEFAELSKTARRSNMSAFTWSPVVRFCSSHYTFDIQEGGTPILLQTSIAADNASHAPLPLPPNHQKTSHFGEPSARAAGSLTAKTSQGQHGR